MAGIIACPYCKNTNTVQVSKNPGSLDFEDIKYKCPRCRRFFYVDETDIYSSTLGIAPGLDVDVAVDDIFDQFDDSPVDDERFPTNPSMRIADFEDSAAWVKKFIRNVEVPKERNVKYEKELADRHVKSARRGLKKNSDVAFI
jgi:copper chaperone CopZ